MRRFEHDGIRFAYRDAGDGPPFAFQHGLGGDAAQPASLCRSAVRLVTLECRGHGDTEPLGPEEALSFATFAADLAALLDHLGLEEVVLGGVSMGAGVALALALAHPARVRGLALVRPAWVDRGSPENLRAYPLIAALLRAHGRRGREAFAASEEYALVRARSPASAASLLGQFDRPGAVARAAVLERLAADAPVAPGAPWGALAMPAL
ncbi:MAG TPA: alpha/beta hydrolase, partial [Solirubrobacteraceae bacterium]|nr:alpha/beta hydrolase [Solirubrobacteraceae bacterium]